MKYIKKTFLFLIIAFLFILAGCNNEENKKTDLEYLNEFANTLEFDETLTSNLSLPSSYTYNNLSIQAIWSSSNEKILTNVGTFYHTFTTELITLEVHLSLNDQTINKSFDLVSPIANDCLEEAYKTLINPLILSSSVEFIDTITYGKYTFLASYSSSNENILTSSGKVTYASEDKDVTLKVKLTYQSLEYENTINVTVKALNNNGLLNAIKDLGFDCEVSDDLTLPNNVLYNGESFILSWSSNNEDILSSNGIINPSSEEITVKLTASSILDVSYEFTVIVKEMSNELAFNKVLNEFSLPRKISYDILLPSTFSYGVIGSYKSSDESLFSNTGKILKNSSNTNITLTLILSKGEDTMSKEFNLVVSKEDHLYQDRTFSGEKENLEINQTKLVLKQNALSGTYTSPIIAVSNFTEGIASYAATSSQNATCEIQVRVLSNGVWSKYLSYGTFGQGLKNSASDQSDTYVKISTDEIIMLGNNVGTSFQLKLIIKRTSLDVASPIVSLLAFAIKYVSYTYDVDTTKLPSEILYDVPCLYQHDVPTIGGSICSATSSTMLLKYKGHDFSNLATYEHEYIANIVKDYGHNIFGNWVYNTIGMSSFGEVSYVKRFYSSDEMLYNLANIGPIAASIKGTVVTDKKTYTTNGHLIVVKGYKIENGVTTIYINDPNVKEVSVQMTLEAFLNVYRMVSYIIE